MINEYRVSYECEEPVEVNQVDDNIVGEVEIISDLNLVEVTTSDHKL